MGMKLVGAGLLALGLAACAQRASQGPEDAATLRVEAGTSADHGAVWYDGTPDAQREPIPLARGWARLPTLTTATLRRVWGTSARDVFIVGDNGTILHFDGVAVRAMVSGTTERFWGLWGSGPSDVYAAGPGLFHYDGNTWRPVDTGQKQGYSGVHGTGKSDVVAVGPDGGLVEFDGVSWKLAAPTPFGGPLHAVWVGPSGCGWAVGGGGSLIPAPTLRKIGGAWREAAPIAAETLMGVWGNRPDNVYAVGLPGVMRFDGNSWSRVQAGLPAKGGATGVWGTPRGVVYVVGWPTEPGDPSLLLKLDGATWSRIDTGSRQYMLHGVWGDEAGRLFLVGDEGTLLRYEP